jgi:uncharacterized membrane protein YgaE (UPF0421/DUF939 family)
VSRWQSALFQGLSAAVVAVFAYVTANLATFLRETYWAPIAAVVVLYPDREATRKAAGQRLIGTLIGSVIGWLSAVTWNHSALLYGVWVAVGVGVCYLLRLDTAARLCAVAITVITIVARQEAPRVAALHRCIEVSYGVACALAYTVIVDVVRKRWGSASSGGGPGATTRDPRSTRW